jgi:hypothetical protein
MKCLNDYYLKNNSKIYSRSTTDSLETDFLLWSNKTFKSKLALHSIKNAWTKQFYKTSLKSYQSLFDYYLSRKLNEQNLYEYLLNENITYLTTTLNSWNIETSIFAKSKILYTVIQIPFNLKPWFSKGWPLKKLITLYKKKNSNNSLDNHFSRMQFCYKYLNKMLPII